jgi:hypothetical protein
MIIELPQNLKLIRLPVNIEIIIYLIREELKSCKVSSDLEGVGFDTTFSATSLASLILSFLGFRDRSDELYNWYYQLMKSYTERFEVHDSEKLHLEAFNFYVDLEIKKRTVEPCLGKVN